MREGLARQAGRDGCPRQKEDAHGHRRDSQGDEERETPARGSRRPAALCQQTRLGGELRGVGSAALATRLEQPA
jgi:hypothetical protein